MKVGCGDKHVACGGKSGDSTTQELKLYLNSKCDVTRNKCNLIALYNLI
jgi:hypothetical protein